jgi:hypothetical protein
MSHVYLCPGCSKMVAAPKNRGNLELTEPIVFQCPHCDRIFDEHSFADAGVPNLIPVTPDSAPYPHELPPHPTENHETIDIELADSKTAPADSIKFSKQPASTDLSREEKLETIQSAATALSRLNRYQNGHSIWKSAAGIFFGGILGLAIAYWLLNFLWGPQFDWLNIYLPGCPHTANNWPCL